MRMRKERSVEVVKVCTKNLFFHHHPTSTLVFVLCALWSRICKILIGSRIVTHHLQREKEKRRKILLISSSLLETPTLVSFFLANVRTMMKFTKFLLLGLLIGLFAGISVPSSA